MSRVQELLDGFTDMTLLADVHDTAAEILKEHKGRKGKGFSIYKPAKYSARQARRMLEVVHAFKGIHNGHEVKEHFHQAMLVEAMAVSDFPLIFATILDRQLLANYKMADRVMSSAFKMTTLRNFRTADRFTIDGGEGILPDVDRGGEYRERVITEGVSSYALAKKGATFALLWEDLIDDQNDLDIFLDLSNRLANAAVQTEEKAMTEVFWGTGGPDATFFGTANGSAGVQTTALDIPNLETAVELMLEYTTPIDNNPIAVVPKFLIIPPALQLKAANILRSIELRGAGDGASQIFGVFNTLPGLTLEPKMNPWIPLVATDGTIGKTTWALFQSPTLNRPAAEFAHLRGMEEPQLMLKDPNQTSLSGAALPWQRGSYERDDVGLKVMHIFASRTLDGRAALASKGQA